MRIRVNTHSLGFGTLGIINLCAKRSDAELITLYLKLQIIGAIIINK